MLLVEKRLKKKKKKTTTGKLIKKGDENGRWLQKKRKAEK